MFFYTKEDVIKLTPQWTGERMEDGRPKVPASVLERMRKLTLEEVWGPPIPWAMSSNPRATS